MSPKENGASDYTLENQHAIQGGKIGSADSIMMRYPFRIRILDSIALIHDLHNEEYYLHAFTYPEMKPIASFGKRGNGPGELLIVENIRFFSLDSIWVLDSNKNEITRWSLSVENRSANLEQKISIDKQVSRALDFAVTNQGFIVPGYLGEYRLHHLNFDGKVISSEGEIPCNNPKQFKDYKPALAQAWRSFIDYNPINRKIVLATQLGEVIEIIDSNERHVVIKGKGGDPVFNVSQQWAIPAGIMGYWDVQLTQTRIYAIFQGEKMSDVQTKIERNVTQQNGGQQLYVFDTEGNSLAKYILDTPISGFTVNEETKTLVGLDVNSNTPVTTFHLPDLQYK